MMHVLLFDIDGTLVLTGGAGSRAMNRAFEDLFQIADAFRGIPMPGRTDLVILADAAVRAGIALDPPRLTRFRERYCTYLLEEIVVDTPRKGVMPGVRPLLDALRRRDDVLLALLTGNYETAARIKLQHFDLWHYFACGAYGDEGPDRNALVAVALNRIAALPPSRGALPRTPARSLAGTPPPPAAPSQARFAGLGVEGNVVVIGDTPLDVACARAAGARAIAVATGSHGVEALAASGPDAVLPDLSDTAAFFRLIDGWARAASKADAGRRTDRERRRTPDWT